MEILYFLLFIVLLDIAALRWGIDSRDSTNCIEWARRCLRHYQQN